LLNTLTFPVIFPAMIEASNVVSLDPPYRELRLTMGAARTDQMRCTAFTTVKRERFAHDTDRNSTTRWEVLCSVNRVPESPHEASGQCAGTCMDNIDLQGAAPNA